MHTTTTHSPTRTHHLARADHEAALSISRWRAAKYRWIAALLAALGGVVGCSPGEEPPDPWDSGRVTPTTVAPEPTASVAPTEPTTDPTTEAIQAAIQTLRDYHDAVNEVFAQGYDSWDHLLPRYWGDPELSARNSAYYEAAAGSGMSTTGKSSLLEPVIESIQIHGGTQPSTIHLSYCEDNSGLRHLSSDGTELPRMAPDSLKWDVVLVESPDGWQIVQESALIEEAC